MSSMCEICRGLRPGAYNETYICYPNGTRRVPGTYTPAPCDCLRIEFNGNIVTIPEDIVNYIRRIDAKNPEQGSE